MYVVINKILVLSVFHAFIRCNVMKNNLFRLDIVHYNDFHSRFEETSISYPVCLSNDTLCLGGFARLYQGIQMVLKEKPDALLLNAGDTFQGTYWYTLLKWNVTQTFINLLPHDAHTIGNHEFDDGIPGLSPYLAALQAPVVIANINTKQEPSLEGLYKPHIIIEKRGRKIGIIGVTTTESRISSHPGKVVFMDPIETVKAQAQTLADQGVDIIIVLSHCGLDVEKKIALKAGENVDIIVGGHSHSLLWNGTSPSKEYVSGPYPIVMISEASPNHRVLIVTAACFTKYLGNITAYFDDEGNLDSFEGQPIYLNRSIPEDPEIKRILQPYTDKLHSLVNEQIGYSNDDLLAKDCSSQECAIGNLIADAFLSATKEMKISKLPHVAFLLRNMIRGSIPKGVITRGEIINALPFTNRVTTFTLLGKYIIEAFRLCMTNYWVAKPFQGPWMPHVAGLRLTLNLTEGVDVKVLINNGDRYINLDPDEVYQVTTVNFLSDGGNGFEILHKFGGNKIVLDKDSDILEKYVKHKSPITASLDQRLTVIN